METQSISFDELLGWDMWKTFIKIHSKFAALVIIISTGRKSHFKWALFRVPCDKAAKMHSKPCKLIGKSS